ncbi:hypothetical protein Moror_13418 [Moniliophthora roreri MCA 2997]|uniref:Uncharacterized protein n=2 Tax=Moniliophthora roreri TaxID=221103 RepID=V2WND5_MONRO|nr:hypothetical protein Moror_13418 [Moniliophthora roreri MCA 2997]
MLNNEILIDGKPLGRLPTSFTAHDTYRRIFGQNRLDAAPADLTEPDMEFSSRNLISGNQVFLSMKAGTLVIRSSSEGKRQELIPHHELRGDLPTFLVEDYTHWLDLSERVIELRPLDNMWTSHSYNWRIQVGSRAARMWKPSTSDNAQLVDIGSRTATMLASRLSSMESPEFLITTYCEDNGLNVDVSRYRLSFQLGRDGKLACLSFPGMIVDENQSAGVMIGLRNQLVLRESCIEDSAREVLIPVGEVCFSCVEGHHTITTIDKGSGRCISYYQYKIDPLLGHLVGNIGLHSKLFQIYLHAVTSHCLPDELTGWTGTEEALHELQSAACKSFQDLDQDCLTLIQKLYSLTPRREYYPPHLKVMQTVHWNKLPPTAQHDSFARASQAIVDLALQLQTFSSQCHKGFPVRNFVLDSVNLKLLSRAALRNFHYHPPESQPSHSIEDASYISWDVGDDADTTQESLVYWDVALITIWPS